MIIAFIGNDGSGKSTLMNSFSKKIRDRNESVICLPEFNYPLINLLRRIGGEQTNKTQERIQTSDSSPSFILMTLPYVMLVESTLQIMYYKLFHRKTVVLKDRCSYDYIATWREVGTATRLVEFLYRHSVKPDFTLYISTSPSLAKSRRAAQTDQKDSGKTLDFYIEKKKIYDRLYDEHAITLVENNGNMTESLERVDFLVSLKISFKKIRTIAISGLDGAGKSTTMEHLSNFLDTIHTPHRVVHFYYNYTLLKIVRSLFGHKAQNESVKNELSIKNEKQSLEKGKGRWWHYLVITDALIQYWFYRLFNPHKVILFDRFFPDYFVSFDFLNIKYNRESLSRLLPKPDIYFLQIADYKILHSRKPEHTLDFFKICYEKYEHFSVEYELYTLDSSTDGPTVLVNKLLEIIRERRL